MENSRSCSMCEGNEDEDMQMYICCRCGTLLCGDCLARASGGIRCPGCGQIADLSYARD